MKREWKRSLCRLLILAMLVGSFQSNGLAVHAAEKAAALTGTEVDDTGDIATSRQDAEDTKEDAANGLIGIDSYGDSADLTIETETDTCTAAEMDKIPLTVQDDPSTVENLRTGYQEAHVRISDHDIANNPVDYDVVVNDTQAAPYLVFKGAFEGQTLNDSWDKEFYICNGDDARSVSNINVAITDADREPYQGSASHFEWTLEKTDLPAGTDKKAKLVIGPKDTSSPGVYRAIVRVTADEIAPINFEVTWVVAKKLTVSAPSVEETSGLTGQKTDKPKQYEVELKADGAGIYYNYGGIGGILQTNDSAYYATYTELNNTLGQGVTASQAVTWYVRVKGDDEDDTKLISLAQAFNELGINKDDGFTTVDPDAISGKIGDDHMIEIAGSDHANDSTYNTLSSYDLAGGGTYEFTAVAQVNEVKMDYGPGTVVIPAQRAEMDVTLNITPGKDVYVLYDHTDTVGVDSPDNYWGTSRTVTVLAHNTTAGTARVVPEYKKVTGFDFRDLAEGYADYKVSRRFVINNEVDSILYYQIKTLDADKENPSDAFLINSFASPEAVEYPDEYYGDYLKAANQTGGTWTAGVMNNNGYFDLCLQNGLPAGDYSGWLVIEGSGFETIEIPLSASVSPGDYSITLRDAPYKGLESDSFTFYANANSNGEPIGNVWAFVDGNRPLNILRTAELDNNGQEIVDEGRRKLKVGTSSDQAFIERTNIMNAPDHEAEKIDPARDVDAPYAETDDYAVLPIIVKDGSTSGEYSTTLRVWYEDLNVEGGQSYKDITINYVLFNDNVDGTVTVTPEQADPYIEMGNVEEGYNVADNSVEFTVSVSGDPDPVNALYGLDVAVTNESSGGSYDDVFIIEGVKPDKIMPGGSAKFTIKPLENLPAGTYRPVVTFTADNLETPIVRKLIFVVTASETFSTYAVADDCDLETLYHHGQYGWTLESGFKDRLGTALSQLATIQAENFKVIGDSLDNGFLINLNGNTNEDLDVKVYNKSGILTVTKLKTCNVNRYENVLVNTSFEPDSQSFRYLKFKILETVELDLEDVLDDLVETKDGGVIVDNKDLGPVNGFKFRAWIRDLLDDVEYIYRPKFRFLVPYGQAFNTAQEKISCGKAAFGLPYMNITAYTEGRGSDNFMFIVKDDSQEVTGLTGSTIIKNDVGAKAGWNYNIDPQPHEHKWIVANTDWEGSYDTGATGATMHLVCESDSAHKADLTITGDNIRLVSENAASRTKTYRATGYKDGQALVDEITYIGDHEHQWTVSFNWISVSYNVADTKVEAVTYCKVGGETVPATDPKLSNKMVGTTIEYDAQANDPNGKVYHSYKNVDKNGIVRDGHAGLVLMGDLVIVGLQEQYLYTGAPIKPAFNVVDYATGTTLANGTDYSVTFSNNTKVGVATVKVKGKGNYNKSNAETTFKIVNPKDGMAEADLADLKGAKITAVYPKAFEYDGEPHFPETITLKLKGGSEVIYTGTDGEDYVDADGNALPGAVSFSGNVNKGTATVLLSGKNNAKGNATTIKKTFKINAVDLKQASDDDLTVTVAEKTVPWAVKGAQPEVKVKYKGRELLVGQDFKVTYKNNKKVGTATVTIAGKGNYAKTRKDAASFVIETFDLSGADIIATTAAASVKVTKVKVTILDKAGNAIPAGKLNVMVEGAAGAKLAAGETVTVKASARGAELKESCTEEVTVQAGDLSKAKIKVNIKKTYTGEEIELTDDDMKLVTVTVAGATLVYGEDFEIAGYSNNIKKGSMVVTIVGKGEKYSGSKTFKVKIEPKPIGTS